MSSQLEHDLLVTREWLWNYINDYCIYRVKPGDPFLLGKLPNEEYTWQFYLRRGLTNPTFLRALSGLFWFQFAELYKQQPFQIAGLETGATPIVTALVQSNSLGCNGLIIRADRKKYGLFNRFEGIINYDLPVLIVDDFCNSKNTISQAKRHCRTEGLKLHKYGFVIVNKGDTAFDKYDKDDTEFASLFRVTDFHLDYERYQEHAKDNGKEIVPWTIERCTPPRPITDNKGLMGKSGAV